jgi:hypothetical protein
VANSQKAKGTRWETAVLRFLRDAGLYAVKPRQEGFLDVGDIHAPPFVIQAKDYSDLLAGIRASVDGYQVQRSNAGMPFGVGVVKRARKPVEDAYVVIRLADLTDLIRAVQRGEQD